MTEVPNPEPTNADEPTGGAASTERPDPRVVDIYKLAVEMADRMSARRALANGFFLTVNTTLVAVVGLPNSIAGSVLLPIAVCVAGVAVSVCWFMLLMNYRRLSEAKFAVINKIEAEHLPLKIFSDEWTYLDGDQKNTATGESPKAKRLAKVRVGFKQLGEVERIIPVVFGLLYVILFIGRVV